MENIYMLGTKRSVREGDARVKEAHSFSPRMSPSLALLSLFSCTIYFSWPVMQARLFQNRHTQNRWYSCSFQTYCVLRMNRIIALISLIQPLIEAVADLGNFNRRLGGGGDSKLWFGNTVKVICGKFLIPHMSFPPPPLTVTHNNQFNDSFLATSVCTHEVYS